MKVVVVGGGIIGLSIAWRVARRGGCEVALVDAPSDCPSATSASAAMLAPGAEAHLCTEPLYRLGRESLALYPRFLEELELESGHSVDLTSLGTLLVAEDREGLQWLRRRSEELSQLGEPFERLSATEARAREPVLTSSLVGALHLPKDRTLSLPSLLQALRKALCNYRVTVVEKRVTALAPTTQRWQLQLHEGEATECDEVVIAAGAWVDQISFPASLLRPRLFPNQGVVIEVTNDPSQAPRHMIRSHAVYICPKGDGTMRLGASADYVGRDLGARLGSVREILARAWEILPGIDRETLLGVHVGLRPDGEALLPVVMRSEVIWAVSHGRSGVLLAPWSGERVAKMIHGEGSD